MNRKNNTTIGLDIAKNVFHYAQLNRNGSLCGFALLGTPASGVQS